MRLIDFFDQSVAQNPERLLVAEANSGVRYTFAEGVALSNQVARGLRAAGIAVGDAVGVYTPNCAQALLSMVGLWRAGAAWVPLNIRNSLDETAAFAAEVGLKAIFIHSQLAEHVDSLRELIPSLELVIAVDRPLKGAVTLDELIAGGSQQLLEDWGDAFGRQGDLVIMAATGGTTGSSKPVMITNSVWAVLMDLTTRHFPQTDNALGLVSAPMTHAAGIMAALLACQGIGSIVLPGFDAARVLDTIEAEQITHTFMPPTALYDLVAEQKRHPRDLSSMSLLWLSASPVSPQRLKEAVEVLGPWIGHAFGQAESPAFVTFMPPDELAAAAQSRNYERLASCGRPTWGTQVAVMSDDGDLLPTGEAGELVVRGRIVTPGYFNLPEKTAEIREHGWHHTGDIGRIDEDGYVYVIDRKKDMIISGGFNVYPSEVEAAMMQLPGISQCAVIGVPDDRWGERVAAVIVPDRTAELEEAALIAKCKSMIGSVKAPKSIYVVETLPLTPARKVNKKALRAKFWKDEVRVI